MILHKRKKCVQGILIIWFILISTYLVLVLLVGFHKVIALCLITMFLLLGVQLLLVNSILLHQLNTLFPNEEEGSRFKREKCFLISTLVLFTISYLLMVVRNVALFKIFLA